MTVPHPENSDMSPTPEHHAQHAREWVSFVDDAGETWMFDLTYFRSNWQCIYGSGCAGIEPEQDVPGHKGCCSYGAHFVDDDDLSRVMDIAAALPSDLWQHSSTRPTLTGSRAEDFDNLVDALTTVDEDGDRITRVVDGACVFLNRPGSPTGPGCAIHIAAASSEVEPLEWKPEVCWQLPIRVEHHLDDYDRSTHFVRQWTRADWGEAGEDLGWWCSEASEAYTGTANVARYLRAEVGALAGERIADALVAYIDGIADVAELPQVAVSLPNPTRKKN